MPWFKSLIHSLKLLVRWKHIKFNFPLLPTLWIFNCLHRAKFPLPNMFTFMEYRKLPTCKDNNTNVKLLNLTNIIRCNPCINDINWTNVAWKCIKLCTTFITNIIDKNSLRFDWYKITLKSAKFTTHSDVAASEQAVHGCHGILPVTEESGTDDSREEASGTTIGLREEVHMSNNWFQI